jgi:hypothetical protein
VLGIAAKTQERAQVPEPVQPEQKPAVVAAQPIPTPARQIPKPEVRIAAKAQKPAKPPKPATPQKRRKPPQQSETEVEVEEAKPSPTDKLKDGVVEWGIKRDETSDSET